MEVKYCNKTHEIVFSNGRTFDPWRSPTSGRYISIYIPSTDRLALYERLKLILGQLAVAHQPLLADYVPLRDLAKMVGDYLNRQSDLFAILTVVTSWSEMLICRFDSAFSYLQIILTQAFERLPVKDKTPELHRCIQCQGGAHFPGMEFASAQDRKLAYDFIIHTLEQASESVDIGIAVAFDSGDFGCLHGYERQRDSLSGLIQTISAQRAEAEN